MTSKRRRLAASTASSAASASTDNDAARGSGSTGLSSNNTLCLGKDRRVPARAIEIAILSFLTLGDLDQLRLASHDCVALVKTRMAQSKVIRDYSCKPSMGLWLLGACENLHELHLRAVGPDYCKESQSIRRLLEQVITKNKATLEIVAVPRWSHVLESVAIVAALSKCSRLRAFDAAGISDESDKSDTLVHDNMRYNQVCSELLVNCRELEHITLGHWPRPGRPDLQLDRQMVRQVIAQGGHLNHLSLNGQQTAAEFEHLNRSVSRLNIMADFRRDVMQWERFCTILADKVQSNALKNVTHLHVVAQWHVTRWRFLEEPQVGDIPDLVLPSCLDVLHLRLQPFFGDVLGISARRLPDIRIVSSVLRCVRADLSEASLQRLLHSCSAALEDLQIGILYRDPTITFDRHLGELSDGSAQAFAASNRCPFVTPPAAIRCSLRSDASID